MPDDSIHVRIAEMKVLRGSGTLVILGLGSCVGLFLWDPVFKLGGCAHVILPDSQTFSYKPAPAKFADTAVPAVVDAMVKAGADPGRIESKLTGGATMFASASNPNLLPLGLRNVIAVREALRLAGVPLKAEDIGGTQGRSVYFQVSDGKLLVKRVHQLDAWI
jgi:chemotaxis protein CheD